MSPDEILQKISELPHEERAWLLQKVSEMESIPASLRQSLAEAARGELLDLDEALYELDRP
jgi:predicted transcriptional regulator